VTTLDKATHDVGARSAATRGARGWTMVGVPGHRVEPGWKGEVIGMQAHAVEWVLFGAAVVVLFLLLFWFFGFTRNTRGPARRKERR
jgi:hypothetical protein